VLGKGIGPDCLNRPAYIPRSVLWSGVGVWGVVVCALRYARAIGG